MSYLVQKVVACLLFISLAGCFGYDHLTRPLSTQEIAAIAEQATVIVRSGPSLSTGFAVSKYGHIVCTSHGIYSKVSLVYFKGNDTPYKAVLKARSKGLDVAILQMPMLPPGVKPLSLDTSPKFSSGMTLVTVGHPVGTFFWSTSSGVLSKEVFTPQRFLQVTLPINSGNSGGPVLNDKGKVVGIIRSMVPSLVLVGFAVPGDIIDVILRSAKP